MAIPGLRKGWVLIRPPSTRIFAARRWQSAGAVQTPKVLELRDYQEECIQAVLASFARGAKRVGVSLATGSGKTVIFTRLIDRVRPLSDKATQTLILAHRKELVEQAAGHCDRTYPDKSIEIEQGNSKATGLADITVASVASLSRDDRIGKFDPARFKLILVDEAHHIVSRQYLKVLEHMKLGYPSPDSPNLVGVSATFSRHDGLRLGVAIDEIVYHKDYVDMIDSHWLSKLVFTTIKTAVDMSAVKLSANKDFDIASLSRAVNTEVNNELIVRSWLSKATGRKSSLVFCVDISHVTALRQQFLKHKIGARAITSETQSAIRVQTLDDFRNGIFPVLINCGVFTEGTDIPNIDCVVLARPTRSRNLLVQMIGRGLRLFPGKENCHIIDMVSSLELGIITTPTLFGLHPLELVDQASPGDMMELREKQAVEVGKQDARADQQVPRLVTITDYNSVWDLIADTSDEKHMRTLSANAWVSVAPDRYVLRGVGKSFLRIQKDDAEEVPWSVWLIEALPAEVSESVFARPRRLMTAATLEEAVHGADTKAAQLFVHSIMRWRAPWRFSPASESQLAFLNRFRREDNQLKPEDITKGQAQGMITKIRHGARGRFTEYMAAKKKMERIRVKQIKESQVWQQMSAPVQVGPLSS